MRQYLASPSALALDGPHELIAAIGRRRRWQVAEKV